MAAIGPGSGGAIAFEIDVTGLKHLVDALPGFADAVAQAMDKAMDETGMLLTTMVAARTPTNYGLLRSSIQWPGGFNKQGNAIDTLRGVVGASNTASVSGVSTSVYVWYVEEGTSPHWPPIAPLKLWAVRKFGDERIAYPVQKAIAARGTYGEFMFVRAWTQGGRDKTVKIWEKVPVEAIHAFERSYGH